MRPNDPKNSSSDQYSDVLILGAGFAGACLARQLKLQQPDLSIRVLDAKTTFDYWVGESTVEIWVDYAHRCLGLGPYLAKHHVMKQSLRYYWDSAQKDLPVDEMSEFGVNGYHPQLSYQIDRAKFDRDLCELNRELGIDVRLGTRVRGVPGGGRKSAVKIDREGGHEVHTDNGVFRCRWLVDAAGRSSPLCKTLDLGGPDPRHPIGSYWARFKGFNNIDDLGSSQWSRRTAYAQRFLATNHFLYRGYWIWHLPISDDTLSVGVLFDEREAPLKIKSADGFMEFLRGHKCMDQILGPQTEALDYCGLKHVARCAKQIYSKDRWFLAGMSGVFPDAFLSSGCVFVAMGNRLIGEMIRADRNGEDARFENQVESFQCYVKSVYNTFRETNDHRLFGSFEVMAPYRKAGQFHYHNALLPSGMEDLETFFAAVERGEGPKSESAGAYGAARLRLAREFMATVDEAGAYHRKNRGEYINAAVPSCLEEKYHLERDLDLEASLDRGEYRQMFEQYVRSTCGFLAIPFDPCCFDEVFEPDWRLGQTLADVVARIAALNEVAAAS